MLIADIIQETWNWRNKHKVYALLVDKINSGPFDGGCVIFAQALQQLLGGTVMVLVGKTSPDGVVQPQHAVLKLGDKLVDADGALPANQFVARFERNELAVTGGTITGIRELADSDLPEAPRDQMLSSAVAHLLNPRHQPRQAPK